MFGSTRRRILEIVMAMLAGIGFGACSDLAFAMRAMARWDDDTAWNDVR